MKKKKTVLHEKTRTIFIVLFMIFLSLNSYSQINENHIRQATEIIYGVDELLAPTPAQIQRREAEANAVKNATEARENTLAEYKNSAESHFKNVELAKYLSSATKGVESTRMYLIRTAMYRYSYCNCDISHMLPERENWLKEAIKNNNAEAFAIVGNSAINKDRNWSLGLTVTEGIQILEKAASDRSYLNKTHAGIYYKEITPELAKEKNLGNIKGIYISDVAINGAAEIAGLQKGDVCLFIGEIKPVTGKEFLDQIALYHPGDEIKLTYFRADKEHVANLVLKNRPIDQLRVDIMLILARYYNRSSDLDGGNDQAKALYWYSKAAENGSPSAMNKLGNIYLSGTVMDWGESDHKGFHKSFFVKYKVIKDEKIAFDWFLKSVANPNYQTTTFHDKSKTGSYLNEDSYDELIKMYGKGIGCEKSEEKANELSRIKDELLLQRKLSK